MVKREKNPKPITDVSQTCREQRTLWILTRKSISLLLTKHLKASSHPFFNTPDLAEGRKNMQPITACVERPLRCNLSRSPGLTHRHRPLHVPFYGRFRVYLTCMSLDCLNISEFYRQLRISTPKTKNTVLHNFTFASILIKAHEQTLSASAMLCYCTHDTLT